jgi:outer membrane receptor protein involved in Fe transport
VPTGRSNVTVVNRDGRTSFDREHVFNLVGLKRFDFGKHDLSLGAYHFFRSGLRWGLRPNTTLIHPVSRQTITTTTYTQSRDAEQLEDTFNLNLTADWTFPIAGKVRGKLGAEVANVTDEQEAIVVNLATGNVSPGVSAYQTPREIRVKAGISF